MDLSYISQMLILVQVITPKFRAFKNIKFSKIWLTLHIDKNYKPKYLDKNLAENIFSII